GHWLAGQRVELVIGELVQRAAQLTEGGMAVGRATLRVGGRRPLDKGVYLCGDGRDSVGRAWDLSVHMGVGDLDGAVAGEGLDAGEEFVEEQAGGVDVAALVGASSFDLLGRQVGRGAPDQLATVAG